MGQGRKSAKAWVQQGDEREAGVKGTSFTLSIVKAGRSEKAVLASLTVFTGARWLASPVTSPQAPH